MCPTKPLAFEVENTCPTTVALLLTVKSCPTVILLPATILPVVAVMSPIGTVMFPVPVIAILPEVTDKFVATIVDGLLEPITVLSSVTPVILPPVILALRMFACPLRLVVALAVSAPSTRSVSLTIKSSIVSALTLKLPVTVISWNVARDGVVLSGKVPIVKL